MLVECARSSEGEAMNDKAQSKNNQDEEIESALIEADLFIKYGVPNRALERLARAIEQNPRSIPLRERLREVASIIKNKEEAARQCLALATLYIAGEDFDVAHERLLQAKQFDPRISIASGLEAIRRARRPDLDALRTSAIPRALTLNGDLSVISIFDIVQVIENSRLTGVLTVVGETEEGSAAQHQRVLFNEGRIVGAVSGEATGTDALRRVIETTEGTFDFERSSQALPVSITSASNTNLILDMLRQLDEEKK